MVDLASRIPEVRVTGPGDQMRSAKADAEDRLSRVSAKLMDESSSAGKQPEAYYIPLAARNQWRPSLFCILCASLIVSSFTTRSRPFSLA